MSWLKLILGSYRVPTAISLAIAILVGAAGLGWLAQGWRLGEQLAEQAGELERQTAMRDKQHASTLADIQRVAAGEARRAHEKRLTLEQQLQASSQTQYRKLTDAEKSAARLRDRLATAELRLSVQLANPNGRATLPATAVARRLVDGAGRAEIDSGSAQRIIAIVERGDRAIIALGMCQAYVRAIGLEG